MPWRSDEMLGLQHP